MYNQFYVLLAINFFSSLGYSLLAPLYPFLAKSRGVDDFKIGIIFASYAISFVIASFYVPYLVNKIGKSRLFKLAIFLESVCTIIFGILDYVESYHLFTLLSMTIRLVQGLGSAISGTLVYSITASISDDENLNKLIGNLEFSFSMGLTLGPLIGSILYNLGGYAFTFIICGSLNFICLPYIASLKISDNKYESPSFMKIILNMGVLFTTFALIIDISSSSYIYPVFSNHLLVKYGIGIETSSIFFVITMFSYFILIQFLNKFYKYGMKPLISIGLFLNGLSVLFLAPVSFLPQGVTIILIGLIVVGAAGAFVTIPGLIDLINTLKNDLNIEEEASNDISSAIYNLALNIGEALGPIYGGAFTHYYSFEKACYGMSAINLGYCIIFMFYTSSKIKLKSKGCFLEKKDVELDYDYKELKSIRKRSENMEHHAVGRYRAFSMASMSNNLAHE